jgi:3' exoribonuclease, RNase T-like
MRYFLDTEFIECGRHTPLFLISIALMAEDGRGYYREVRDFPKHLANDWVKGNVFPHLGSEDERIPCSMIAKEILMFLGTDEKPEFWGYYADYDWVVFCQLFGSMVDLPKGWPMYCRDIKQLCDDLGNPRLPAVGKDEHHALSDAVWNKQAWEYLMRLRKERCE